MVVVNDPDPHRHHLGHKRDVWGDDPEEVDASAVYEQFKGDERVQRKWSNAIPLAPLNVVWRFLARNGRRIGITLAGFTVLLVGVARLVRPGPGWLVIFVCLEILAREYVWAQRLLGEAKRRPEQAKNAVVDRKNNRATKREARRNGNGAGSTEGSTGATALPDPPA